MQKVYCQKCSWLSINIVHKLQSNLDQSAVVKQLFIYVMLRYVRNVIGKVLLNFDSITEHES